jgi:5'-AMP-activated protein kinase, catalytic alpha subunit
MAGHLYTCTVAVKSLDKNATKANELAVNARREIAIMKALKRKNIVSLQEVLSSTSKLYIIMDLVRGCELFEMIERKGELDDNLARRYFQYLADGIDYCHRRGVYHRDLKPKNPLVDENGTLKNVGFRVYSIKRNLDAGSYAQRGTPYYCAPEIINDVEETSSGVKIDVWSCGIIPDRLLTGELPF